MPPKTIKSNPKLGEAIKHRRHELNLTIEEAASRAGIGTKTWSRYESGESIRKDKVRSLCKALNWVALPETDGLGMMDKKDIGNYMNNKAWSPYLMENYGKFAALSFVLGSEILLDEINEDLRTLSQMPKGTHIGEIPSSFVSSIMPEQFITRYDYEFMWALRNTLIHFRTIIPHTRNLLAHSVIDELVLYLVVEEARLLIEELDFINVTDDDEEEYTDWASWPFDIFDDVDLIMFLYSDQFTLTPDDQYHFDHWFEQQFYMS